MNKIDISLIKPTMWTNDDLATWKYYYFHDRSRSKKCFAYIPTKTINRWVWFEYYYQWYNCNYSIKGSSEFKSIRTIKDIDTFHHLRDLQTLYTNHYQRICTKNS